MTTAREVLQLHLDLRSRLENPDGMLAKYLAAFISSQYGNERSGLSMATTVSRHLQYARTYLVEPDLSALAMRRADDVDHMAITAQFGQFEPPFAMGFCCFTHPLETIELRGRTQRSVALTWGPAEARYSGTTRSGKLVVLWTNAHRAIDDIHREAMAGTLKGLVGAARDEEPMQPSEYVELMGQVGGWAPAVVDFIPADARLGNPRIEVPLEKRQIAAIEGWEWAREGTSNYARIICALFELMDETLAGAHVEKALPDRATQRRAARAKINTDITVIKLRRQAQPVQEPGSGTPLAWRVPVNGHHRTYHRGTDREFKIWIRGHWRGDPEAPVRANRKLYHLSR